MENASGGFMSDLSFEGGRYGMWLGNQQFTVRNVRFSHCQTAIYQHWNWAWTFMDVRMEACEIGLEIHAMQPDEQGVGSLVLSDWFVVQARRVVQLECPVSGRIVLDGVDVAKVECVVGLINQPLLAGPYNGRVDFWVKAPVSAKGPVSLGLESACTSDGLFMAGHIRAPRRPWCLVDGAGRWFGKEKPQCLF